MKYLYALLALIVVLAVAGHFHAPGWVTLVAMVGTPWLIIRYRS